MNDLTTEPDFQKACSWWPDVKGQVTPVGWKDHMFRFNVLYNGTILADPSPHLVYSPFQRFQAWEDQGVQLNFPYLDAYPWWEHYGRSDDGMAKQGWVDCPAPVLRTQWARHGLLLQQEVFGYVPGGEDTSSGVEPLFAWIRLSIQDRTEALYPEDPPYNRFAFDVRITRPHIVPTMECGLHLLHNWPEARYPRELSASRRYCPKQGYRVIESGRKVRLGVAPGSDCIAKFSDGEPTANDRLLKLWVPPYAGTRIDLLLPMLPCSRRTFDDTLRRGYDPSLREANRYWKRSVKSAATVSLPEKAVSRAIRFSLRNVGLYSEKNPLDKQYSLLVGSFGYPMVWSTQIAMEIAMTLDPYGFHDEADKHLETFRLYQGQRTPPSPHIKNHPGHLAAPADRNHIPWMTDHGAILYAVCRHVQLTGDKSFISRWLEPIVKACEYIREARSVRGHGGFEGLLPPGGCSDRRLPIQGVWSDGWHYKGYTSAVHVLKKLGHPRAAEFKQDAEDYRQTFQKAFRACASKMPVWRDRRGKRHRLIPMSLYDGSAGHTPPKAVGVDENAHVNVSANADARHPFYLDTGPLFLVFSGLLKANDPAMKSARAWFREGPPHRHYRRDSSRWQPPVLDHEMSSCEPFYSWNVFHTHQEADRIRFLEGMYSQFAGAMSRQTYSFMEQRNSQFSLSPQYPCFLMARLSVLDDQITADEFHILRLVPLAWIRKDRRTKFENMPTDFGPVSLSFGLSRDGKSLSIHFEAKFRNVPSKIVLHKPPLNGIRRVLLNRREVVFSPSRKTADITPRGSDLVFSGR